MVGELHAEYGEKSAETLEERGLRVSIAGRMMSRRVMGKASFAHLQDMSGRMQLFVQRAKRADVRFELGDEDAVHVARICRLVAGSPLAIELAAARLRMLSAAQIAARLHDRFRLLTGGRRTALPRQQTLQALIDWSWNLLDKKERLLLSRLSVFAGGYALAYIVRRQWT